MAEPPSKPDQNYDATRGIKEGAGLDESKLNTEFVNFIQKYGAYILLLIALIIAIPNGLAYLEQQESARLDQAYTALADARSDPQPRELIRVAEANEDQGAVPHIARLAAADIYLSSYRAGVKPGYTPEPPAPDGTTPEPPEDMVLAGEDRDEQLAQAESLYQRVADDTRGESAEISLHLGALNGLAAVAESRGDLEQARTLYDRIIEQARRAKINDMAEIARYRRDTLELLADEPEPLPSITDLFAFTSQQAPPTMPAPQRMRLNEDGQFVPAEPGLGTPQITFDRTPIEADPDTQPDDQPPGDAPAPGPDPAQPEPANEQPEQ